MRAKLCRFKCNVNSIRFLRRRIKLLGRENETRKFFFKLAATAMNVLITEEPQFFHGTAITRSKITTNSRKKGRNSHILC